MVEYGSALLLAMYWNEMWFIMIEESTDSSNKCFCMIMNKTIIFLTVLLFLKIPNGVLFLSRVLDSNIYTGVCTYSLIKFTMLIFPSNQRFGIHINSLHMIVYYWTMIRFVFLADLPHSPYSLKILTLCSTNV